MRKCTGTIMIKNQRWEKHMSVNNTLWGKNEYSSGKKTRIVCLFKCEITFEVDRRILYQDHPRSATKT